MKNVSTHAYFLRHGAIDLPPSGVSAPSTPLNDTGRVQAATLGRYLRAASVVPNRVYVSPMDRNRQTARIVLAELGAAIPVRENIGLQGPGPAESDAAAAQRIYGIVNKLCGDVIGNVDAENILFFAHGMTIRCMAARICNWSQADIDKTAIPNASISLMIRTYGHWQVSYVGNDPLRKELW